MVLSLLAVLTAIQYELRIETRLTPVTGRVYWDKCLGGCLLFSIIEPHFRVLVFYRSKSGTVCVRQGLETKAD